MMYHKMYDTACFITEVYTISKMSAWRQIHDSDLLYNYVTMNLLQQYANAAI